MIFITSYPYIGPRHIRVFDYFKRKSDLIFILPRIWRMKSGKVILRAISKPGLRIISTSAYFFHSRYFIIAGLLKGWMPKTNSILRQTAHVGDVLYTVAEPNLLVTYLNGRIARRLGLKHAFFTWQNVRYEERLSGLKLRLTEWLIRKNISLSEGAVCGNIKAFDILKAYLPEGFKAMVAPISGVDVDQFRPGLSSNFRAKHDLAGKLLLTFIGALDNRKGIPTILAAFAESLAREPNLHLVIIGSGPLDKFIGDYILSNNLSGAITFLPWQNNEDLPGILCSSDIFVYPSEPYGGWEEQFGYSIAEASACGLPVISTNTGSIPDKVVDGKTGFLIRPGSKDDLSLAINNLVTNPELRRKMGEAGRQLIVNNFSHEIVAYKTEAFLRNL